MNNKDIKLFFEQSMTSAITIDFHKTLKPYNEICDSSEYKQMPDNVKQSTRWLGIYLHEHQVNRCPRIVISVTNIDGTYYAFRYSMLKVDSFTHQGVDVKQVKTEDELIELIVKWSSNADDEQRKRMIHFN